MKNLYVPTPRLKTGLFNKVTPPPNYDKNMLKKCAKAMVNTIFNFSFILIIVVYWLKFEARAGDYTSQAVHNALSEQ